MNYFERLKYSFDWFSATIFFVVYCFVLLASENKNCMTLTYSFLVIYLYFLHIKIYPKLLNITDIDLPDKIRINKQTPDEKVKQYIIDIYNDKNFKGNKEILCAIKVCEFYEIYDLETIKIVAEIVDENKNNVDLILEKIEYLLKGI